MEKQLRNHLDGFAGVLGPLQRDVDQGTIVNKPLAVLQLLNATVSGLADGQLELVHVADYRIGVRNLRNLAEFLARVPLNDIHHTASRIIGGWTVVQLSVKLMGISRIRQETGTIPARTFRDDEIRAGHGAA